MQGLEPESLAAEVEAIFEPYIVERFDATDPRWTEITERVGRRQRRRQTKDRLLGAFRTSKRRTQDFVENQYSERWGALTAVEMVASCEDQDPCTWHGQGYLASSLAIKSIHNMLLRRAIAALKPETVLDVGSGNGLNLFILSMAFPEIRFSGMELTESGVQSAQAIQQAPEVPAPIQAFSSSKPKAVDAHRRIEFHVGAADRMPFADDSFDLLYTSLAVEQMESVRDAALTNIARVARKYVVMVEPFADWNQDEIKLGYVRSRGIFQGRVHELERYGLRPVFVYDDLPDKVTLGTGLVVAEVI